MVPVTLLGAALEMTRTARFRAVGERHTSERHRQRQHERRDQHRNALAHKVPFFLGTSGYVTVVVLCCVPVEAPPLPLSPAANEKPASPPAAAQDVAGCATGSARLLLKRPSYEGGLQSLYTIRVSFPSRTITTRCGAV
jgi:hypothetical protein